MESEIKKQINNTGRQILRKFPADSSEWLNRKFQIEILQIFFHCWAIEPFGCHKAGPFSGSKIILLSARNYKAESPLRGPLALPDLCRIHPPKTL